MEDHSGTTERAGRQCSWRQPADHEGFACYTVNTGAEEGEGSGDELGDVHAEPLSEVAAAAPRPSTKIAVDRPIRCVRLENSVRSVNTQLGETVEASKRRTRPRADSWERPNVYQ